MENLDKLKEIDSFLKLFPNLKTEDDITNENQSKRSKKKQKLINKGNALSINDINSRIKDKMKNIRPKKDPNKVRKRKNKKERERSKQLNNTNTVKPDKVEKTINKVDSVKAEKKVKLSDKNSQKSAKTNGHI